MPLFQSYLVLFSVIKSNCDYESSTLAMSQCDAQGVGVLTEFVRTTFESRSFSPFSLSIIDCSPFTCT